jgi:uncharacterized protein (DUF1810 family)
LSRSRDACINGGMDDRFDLNRFVKAQAGVYDVVLGELRAGQKRGYWIWYVFPRISGLGSTPTDTTYSIRSLAEARAYLQHPVLGPRLAQCIQTVNAVRGRSAADIFGYTDELKFRSCLTLFLLAAAGPKEKAPFQAALDKYFDGKPDKITVGKLGR